MKTIKLHYAKYPANGFGGKCNKYYLIDIFGRCYDIVPEWDDVLSVTFYKVADPEHYLNDCGYNISSFYADSPLSLIAQLNDIGGLVITKW